MRTIQTFILRLFIDTDAPETLRGALQGIAESQAHSFTDEQALLNLLRYAVRFACAAPLDESAESCNQEAPSQKH